MQFSTPQQPSEFLLHQPGRKSQTPNPFPEHITKQEVPEQAPTLAGRGHFPQGTAFNRIGKHFALQPAQPTAALQFSMD